MAGRDVKFVRQTPTFIKNFKSKTNYKEPDGVESKLKKLEKSTKEDEEDKEGEMPTVVLGKNVSEQEASEFLAKRQTDDCEEDESNVPDKQDSNDEGKIVFKKPKKRKSEDNKSDKDSKRKFKDKDKSKASSKAVKNSSLLSFDDDEKEG